MSRTRTTPCSRSRAPLLTPPRGRARSHSEGFIIYFRNYSKRMRGKDYFSGFRMWQCRALNDATYGASDKAGQAPRIRRKKFFQRNESRSRASSRATSSSAAFRRTNPRRPAKSVFSDRDDRQLTALGIAQISAAVPRQ